MSDGHPSHENNTYYATGLNNMETNYQLNAWRQITDRNGHGQTSYEQIPLPAMSNFSQDFQPNPFQSFPTTPGVNPSKLDHTFFDVAEPEYTFSEYAKTESKTAELGQDDWPMFQQAIENRFEERRESARCNASDQARNYSYDMATPQLSSETSEEPSSGATSLSPTKPPHLTASVIPSEHGQDANPEQQAGSAVSPTKDTAPRIPKKRNRKVKERSDAEKKVVRDAFLLRNSVAASKCRAKRKDFIKDLDEAARIGKAKNEQLKLEREELEEEVYVLKGMVARMQAEHDETDEKVQIQQDEEGIQPE